MTRFHFLILVLLSTFLQACIGKTTTEESNPPSLETALTEFNAAFQNGDVAKLSSMITDEYIHTNGTVKAIDKTTWLNYLTKRSKELSNGKLTVSSYKMEEKEIKY